MKSFLSFIAATIVASASFLIHAQDTTFSPAEHSTFTTSRPDGRFLSSRAIVHNLMKNNPPRLQYRPGMTPDQFAAWQTDMSEAMARLMKHPDASGLPAPVKLGSWPRDGYTLERWECYPFEGAVVPYVVLIPDGVSATSPAPAVLCIPGFCQTK